MCSVVIKTLKNGILIPIVTYKELHFNGDFKYISFIKLSLRKKCPILENRGKHPLEVIESQMTPSDLAYQRTLLYKFQAPIYKMWNFVFFA